jgi:hypothetical protein
MSLNPISPTTIRGATTSASNIKLSPTNSESTSSTDSQNTEQSNSSDSFSFSLWSNQINPNSPADKYANPIQTKFMALNNETKNAQTALTGLQDAGKQILAGITSITGVLKNVADGAKNKSKDGQEGNEETKDTKATSIAKGNPDLFKRDIG